MATLNDNNVFVSIGGTDVSPRFTNETSLQQSNSLQETTAGAGQTHIQRGKGLIDSSLSLPLVYDTTAVPTDVLLLKVGEEKDLIWGPNTDDAGSPKQQGKYRLESVNVAVSIQRSLVFFETTWQQSDAPTSDIYDGDTF